MQTTADNLKKREYVVLDLCLLIDLRGFRYLANGEEKTAADIVIIANNDRRAAAVAFLIDPRSSGSIPRVYHSPFPSVSLSTLQR